MTQNRQSLRWPFIFGALALACSNDETAPTPTIDSPLTLCEQPAIDNLGDIETEVVFNAYTIQGNTTEALRQSLNSLGPGRFDAFTEWYVNWKLIGDCTNPTPQVGLTITYTFPQWKNRRGASKALIQKWNTYEQALLCHEHEHARIGIQAAVQTVAQLSSIEPENCQQSQQLGQRTFQRILQEHQSKDVALDARTQHGATEGAVFP